MTTVTLANADRLQHVAVSRLTLYVAGRVHALLYPAQAALVGAVRESAGADGMADAGRLGEALRGFEPKWRQFIGDYTALLSKAREQAGSIAYTPWRLRHNRYFTGPVERLQEAYTPTLADYRQLVEMWVRRRNYALQVAQQRVYGDGLNLSQRIWRVDQGGMSQIRGTIAGAMAERTSAVELAQRLETQLNAGQEWPRWSRERLSRMDASERARDLSGLLRGPDDVPAGGSAGISYNALRLARNEIQAANHAVTSDIAQHFPGITGRKVVLSPAHPRHDQCDAEAAGGPYEKSYSALPLHVACLCRYEEVLMPAKEFAAQVGGWVRGENDFLDDYGSWLGVRSFAPFPDALAVASEVAEAMQYWLDGDVDTAAQVLKF